MKTLQELFQEGRDILKSLPQSDLEARLLLQECAQISQERFYSSPGLNLAKPQERRFFRLVGMRKAGYPLSYLTGKKEFWSFCFHVCPGVLIPRPETELLVERVLQLSSRNAEILADIGTGCGNIAIALAKALPKARIIATEISRKAVKIARLNASLQGVSRIEFRQGSLFRPLKRLGLAAQCDFIASNPPYVSESEWEALPAEIRDHEPKAALVAGSAGLGVIRDLAAGSLPYLKPGGYLVMEFGYGQEEKVLSFFEDGWDHVRSFADLSGIPRVLVARRR